MSAREPLDTRVFAMGESGLVASDFPPLTKAEVARVVRPAEPVGVVAGPAAPLDPAPVIE